MFSSLRSSLHSLGLLILAKRFVFLCSENELRMYVFEDSFSLMSMSRLRIET